MAFCTDSQPSDSLAAEEEQLYGEALPTTDTKNRVTYRNIRRPNAPGP